MKPTPSSKNPTEAVEFTRQSAERISDVVRQVERQAVDLTSGPPQPTQILPTMCRIMAQAQSTNHLPGGRNTATLRGQFDEDSGDYVINTAVPFSLDDEFRLGILRPGGGAFCAKLPSEGEWNAVAGHFYRWGCALASGTITAADGTTPGIGSAVIWWLDTATAMVAGQTVPVKNFRTAAIPDGTRLEVKYQPHEDVWWVPADAPNVRNFARVETGWTNTKAGAGVGSRVSETVSVKLCDYDDATTAVGDAFDVQTMPRPSQDTALFTPGTAALGAAGASIVEWAYAPNGDKVIVSHIWDDPIGVVKWESVDVANIRDGWSLCDGSNGTDDLSEKFIICYDSGGAADVNEIGDTGGNNDHGNGTNDHDKHGEAAIVAAIQNHPALEHTFGSGTENVEEVTPDERIQDHGAQVHNVSGGTTGLAHTTTDNRPAYYAYAAIKRVS